MKKKAISISNFRLFEKEKYGKFILIFLLGIFSIYFFRVGLVGNSDTQLGLNISNIINSNSLQTWNERNSGFEFLFPGFFSMGFQLVFNLIGLSFSSTGIIILVLLALVFISFKLTYYLLDIKNSKESLFVISIVSFFAINNDYIVSCIITNSTMIWTFFFFILSLYLFFRYHFESRCIYLFLFLIIVAVMFMDFHMAILAAVFAFSYICIEFFYDLVAEKKINKRLISELLIIIFLVALINAYWLIPNLKGMVFSNNLSYNSYLNSSNNTSAVVDAISGLNSPSFNFIMSQIGNFEKNLFLKINTAGSFVLIILLLASIFFIWKEENKKVKKTLVILFIEYILIFSLSLGPRNPLRVFNFFWDYFPAFKIFRDFSKFNRVIIPIIIILASYSLIKIIHHRKKSGKFLLVLVMLIMAIKFYPYYTNFSQYKPYKIPDYYYDYYEFTKSNKLQDKTQLLPVISWYQGYTWSNQAYDMQEPIGYFTAKPMFVNSATYEENFEEKTNGEISELLKKNSRDNLFGLTSFRNMKYFLLRNDLQEKYLEKSKKDTESLKNSIDSNEDLKLLKKFGDLRLYSIDSKYFLSHFYVPKNSIISKRTTGELPRIFEQENYDISSAVFFEKQNEERARALNNLKEKNENNPVLEIKKINPTKYRIRVHQASGKFPLVFSESFHDGWKMYLAKPNNFQFPISNGQIGYKILDNNGEDQASKSELIQYVKNGWVTALGNGKEKTIVHKKWENMKEKKDYEEKYNIDFISKNFQGTIQNDNLPDGNLTETWFKKPIDDNENHLMVNGYANAWAMDVNEICSASTSSALWAPSPYKGEGDIGCIKNPNGTYDFEMVVEFWPQRLFYIGLFISAMTFLASMGYLLYNYNKRQKELK